MPPAWTLGREIVTQSVYLTTATVVDMAIPDGKVVVGSGAVVTDVWDQGAQALVTFNPSSSDWPNRTNALSVFNGPHPTDSTKWRFILTDIAIGGQGDPIKVMIWLTAVYPLT